MRKQVETGSSALGKRLPTTPRGESAVHSKQVPGSKAERQADSRNLAILQKGPLEALVSVWGWGRGSHWRILERLENSEQR